MIPEDLLTERQWRRVVTILAVRRARRLPVARRRRMLIARRTA